MNRSILFRSLSALVLLGAIIGLGVFAYNAGMVRGLALNGQTPTGEVPGVPFQHYGMLYRMPFFGFPGFGFLGCLIPLFLLFLAFAALRGLFGFRRHGWHNMHYGPWGMPPKDQSGTPGRGVPSMFDEWHRRAHEQPAAPVDEK